MTDLTGRVLDPESYGTPRPGAYAIPGHALVRHLGRPATPHRTGTARYLGDVLLVLLILALWPLMRGAVPGHACGSATAARERRP